MSEGNYQLFMETSNYSIFKNWCLLISITYIRKHYEKKQLLEVPLAMATW